jgi:transposase
LHRDKGSGRPTHCTSQVKEFLKEGLESGKWNTVGQAMSALQDRFGGTYKYQNVRNWMKKCSGVLRPRPRHKKQDKVKTKAFKRGFLGGTAPIGFAPGLAGESMVCR